jgi:hypothetical protein
LNTPPERGRLFGFLSAGFLFVEQVIPEWHLIEFNLSTLSTPFNHYWDYLFTFVLNFES